MKSINTSLLRYPLVGKTYRGKTIPDSYVYVSIVTERTIYGYVRSSYGNFHEYYTLEKFNTFFDINQAS